LRVADISEPFSVEGSHIHVIEGGLAEYDDIAEPAEAFITLRAVGGYAGTNLAVIGASEEMRKASRKSVSGLAFSLRPETSTNLKP